MAVTLSPVPTDPTELEAARNYLAVEIGMDSVGMDSPSSGAADPALIERLDALMGLASALVEREAPGSPQAIKNEAVVRTAGYVRQSDFGGIRTETIGPRSVEYITNHAPAFRNCGAKGLLSPWKARRARSIG